MDIKTEHKEHCRKKPRVRLLFLILLGSAIIAYVVIRFVGCAEYAFLYYNPPYYEPRDLERGETVKESQKETLKKSLEQIEKEGAFKYLKYRDIIRTEELSEQEKKRLEELFGKIEEEEKYKTIWEEKQ